MRLLLHVTAASALPVRGTDLQAEQLRAESDGHLACERFRWQRPARRGGCKAPTPWGAGRALPASLSKQAVDQICHCRRAAT
jgi:hypothetical protein